MKKVLVTASTFSHILNFHLPYLKEFRRLGWEVHVACGGAKLSVAYADKTEYIPIEKSYTSVSNFKACAKLHRMMKREHYDLIITHTSLTAFFTRLAEMGIHPHPKTINVMHGYLFDDATSKLKSLVMKTAEYLVAPKTDVVLTMNEYDTRWASSHRIAKEVSYIPGMGVDKEKLLSNCEKADFGFAASDFVLIYPAEFSKRKNQEMLIRALPKLSEDIKLLLPGNGALLENCKTLAGNLGVKEQVVFPGYVSNIGSIMLAANVAVSSSRSEGLPFNIIEAMLCSLPVVASRVKGNMDLVDDETTGFLYDYNDEEGFSEAIKKLYNNREMAHEMGRKGRIKAESYSIENTFQQVMDEYVKNTE